MNLTGYADVLCGCARRDVHEPDGLCGCARRDVRDHVGHVAASVGCRFVVVWMNLTGYADVHKESYRSRTGHIGHVAVSVGLSLTY